MLATALLAESAWLVRHRAELEGVVADGLRDVARLQQSSSWSAAATEIERTRDRLGPDAPVDLQERLDQAHRDLELVASLDAIRLKRATIVLGRSNPRAERRKSDAQADREYEEVFRKAGMGSIEHDVGGVANRVKASAVRAELIGALDDWAICAVDKGRRARLLDVARRADPDPSRDRVRDPAEWGNHAALAELASAAVMGQSVPLLLALGERLHASGGDATSFLLRVQQAHPSDFWANFRLAKALEEKGKLEEGVDYYRKSLAIRPEAIAAHINIGYARYVRYWLEEKDGAMENYRHALRIDPRSAVAHNNLGIAWKARGRLDMAIDEYREALTIDPELAPAHCNLGDALAAHGDLRIALKHYRRALQLEPDFAQAHYLFGVALLAEGRLEFADENFQRSLRQDPTNIKAHERMHGLEQNDALVHYKQAVQFDPTWVPVFTGLGNIERGSVRLDEAIDHYRQAIQSDRELALAHGAMGHALLARGRINEALSATRRCLELLPKNDYHRSSLTRQLQRSERLLALEGRLPAILQGTDRPADAAECLLFAELCHSKRLFVASATWFDEALRMRPPLADELKASFRYNAPIAAMLAGSGHGDDPATLSETARRTRASKRGSG